MDALLSVRDPELSPIIRRLLGDAALRRQALRGLAAYDVPETAAAILRIYATLNGVEKREALNALTSRTGYADALLAAIAQGQFPARDLKADRLRQLRNLKDAAIERRLAAVWGRCATAAPTPKARLSGSDDYTGRGDRNRAKLPVVAPSSSRTASNVMCCSEWEAWGDPI